MKSSTKKARKQRSEEAAPLDWKPVLVRLADLKPWDQNPRQLTTEQARRIASSLERFGQAQTVAIGPDGEVYDGHQRLTVLLQQHGPEAKIWALQASRALTDEERKRLTIALHAGATGQWDWEVLETWNRDLLLSEGFDQFYRETLERDLQQLSLLLSTSRESAEPVPDPTTDAPDSTQSYKEYYVQRLTIPIYVPTKREPPSFKACYDRSETDALQAEITADPTLSDEWKAFFCSAAERFTRYHFRNIAELYAHAPAEARHWFERLALVLIDVDRAIAQGLAKLAEDVMDVYEDEYGVDEDEE